MANVEWGVLGSIMLRIIIAVFGEREQRDPISLLVIDKDSKVLLYYLVLALRESISLLVIGR